MSQSTTASSWRWSLLLLAVAASSMGLFVNAVDSERVPNPNAFAWAFRYTEPAAGIPSLDALLGVVRSTVNQSHAAPETVLLGDVDMVLSEFMELPLSCKHAHRPTSAELTSYLKAMAFLNTSFPKVTLASRPLLHALATIFDQHSTVETRTSACHSILTAATEDPVSLRHRVVRIAFRRLFRQANAALMMRFKEDDDVASPGAKPKANTKPHDDEPERVAVSNHIVLSSGDDSTGGGVSAAASGANAKINVKQQKTALLELETEAQNPDQHLAPAHSGSSNHPPAHNSGHSNSNAKGDCEGGDSGDGCKSRKITINNHIIVGGGHLGGGGGGGGGNHIDVKQHKSTLLEIEAERTNNPDQHLAPAHSGSSHAPSNSGHSNSNAKGDCEGGNGGDGCKSRKITINNHIIVGGGHLGGGGGGGGGNHIDVKQHKSTLLEVEAALAQQRKNDPAPHPPASKGDDKQHDHKDGGCGDGCKSRKISVNNHIIIGGGGGGSMTPAGNHIDVKEHKPSLLETQEEKQGDYPFRKISVGNHFVVNLGGPPIQMPSKKKHKDKHHKGGHHSTFLEFADTPTSVTAFLSSWQPHLLTGFAIVFYRELVNALVTTANNPINCEGMDSLHHIQRQFRRALNQIPFALAIASSSDKLEERLIQAQTAYALRHEARVAARDCMYQLGLADSKQSLGGRRLDGSSFSRAVHRLIHKLQRNPTEALRGMDGLVGDRELLSEALRCVADEAQRIVNPLDVFIGTVKAQKGDDKSDCPPVDV